MRLFRSRALIIMLAVAMSCGVAAAQPAAATAGKPSAETEALVRRMFDALQVNKMMDAMMASMAPLLQDQLVRQHPGVTAEQRQAIGETTAAVMHDMTPKLLERMIPIYASTYTDDELRAIDAFYESPAGHAIIVKTPQLAPRATSLMREMMPEILSQMRTRLCEKIDCAAKPPAARPS